MVQKGLSGFFERFIEKQSIFINKKVLQDNYSPETIQHREDQINQIANILAPSLKLEKPSNLFIYGKTGTGKTVTVKYVISEIQSVSKTQNIPIKIIYLNCKLKRVADTEYRLIAQICRDFGKNVPPTGLPTDEVYKTFYSTLDAEKQTLILILDEIDELIKKTGDEIIYNFTRMNSELKKSQMSIIGISNDLMFTNNMDPRVKSSLSEEEILFPPYNALQLQDILKHRSSIAFSENALDSGVIEKCAAYAAREHGDARRALELLRVAAEICERNNLEKVQIIHIDEAEDKIERDRIYDTVKTQPKQFQIILYSIIIVCSKRKRIIFTGEVYDIYKGFCQQIGLRPLTQRRVSDVLAEFDMLGVINANVISKGRHGRTREISLAIPNHSLPKIKNLLEEELSIT